METSDLKNRIVEANRAYRSGTALMSDASYDAMLDELKHSMAYDDFIAFNNTLHEVKGKVKHPYVMGSLDKMKTSEPDSIRKFIDDSISTTMNVSAKVDGISCRLHYDDGKLTSASTRGDGEFGEDISEKIKYVNNVPSEIGVMGSIDIRGELVIFKDEFNAMTGFANPRNACAGIMNRKDINPDDIRHISFVAYAVLGPTYTKAEQFSMLRDEGFDVAWNEDFTSGSYDKEDFVDKLIKLAQLDHEYECDGLVVSDSNYHNESKYRPDNQRAIKINQLVATTRLIDVAWEGPSKDGVFCPVGIVDPVELGGSTISRVTLHNLDFIASMGLKYGSKIEMVKSGDIIPKVVALVENTDECKDIATISDCPCCGSALVRDGVNMRCMNKLCSAQLVTQIAQFIKKLGVKSASEKTLVNFGITSFDKLIAFSPNSKYKSEMKLYDELNSKVFTRSKLQLLAALNFKDVGETLINKIVDFYGIDCIEKSSKSDDEYTIMKCKLPLGVGEITLDKFMGNVLENLDIVYKFINDKRWHYVEVNSGSSRDDVHDIKGTICVTGTLKFGSRNKFLEFAKQHGYDSKPGVVKGLTYLINNDIESTSSKNKKAKSLGISIISEDTFMKMVANQTIESELFKI